MDNTGYNGDGLPTSSRILKTDNENLKVFENNKPVKHLDNIEENWSTYTIGDKIRYIIVAVLKCILFLILLYLFLLSLNFMTIGFVLISSYSIKNASTIKFILSNPFAAFSLGIIVTAILQNATATTSIVVSMVGSGIISDVSTGVPIIIGSNIGTCVTNALIALTLAHKPNEFKRAFSGSTINDMFNLLTTAVVLPLEITTGFLDYVSAKIVSAFPLNNPEDVAKVNFMTVLLNPVSDRFILLDENAIERQSNGSYETKIALRCCEYSLNDIICLKTCNYWSMALLESIGDTGLGVVYIIVSIIFLTVCLFGIVKVLSLLITGPIAKGVRRCINFSLPGRFKWFNSIILFFSAFFITLIVQSSNIVTATLVPLCGLGIVSLQRVYLLTLGSNIGTTVTGILTAFTQPPAALKKSLQIAFVYTFFNVIGVILWLPIPKLRLPKVLAKKLGEIVYKYRWFVPMYVLNVYFLIPGFLFGIALIPHWIGLAVVGIPIIVASLFFTILKLLQSKCPRMLPQVLHDFSWMPEFMRSLEPLDRKIKSLTCCKVKKTKQLTPKMVEQKYEANSFTLTNVLRRLSVVEPIVEESMRSRSNNGIQTEENSTSDDEWFEELTLSTSVSAETLKTQV